MGNCFILNNCINYIENLKDKDNTNEFNENYKKIVIQFCSSFFSIFIAFLAIEIFFQFYFKTFILISIAYILVVFYSLKNFRKSYFLFIDLCKEIVLFEINLKTYNKLSRYNEKIKDKYENIMGILNENLNKIIKDPPKIKVEDKYERYLTYKPMLFLIIFQDFKENYCSQKSFLFLAFFCNFVNFLNHSKNLFFSLRNELINSEIKDFKISFADESIFYEQRINEVMQYDIEAFEDYAKLISILKTTDKKEIENLIEDIINKKRILITSLEKIKNDFVKKEDISKKPAKKEEPKVKEKKKDTSISLLDLELSQISKPEVQKEIKSEAPGSVNPMDIIKGEMEIRELKDNFIFELEKYYEKIKKNCVENKNDNEIKEDI